MSLVSDKPIQTPTQLPIQTPTQVPTIIKLNETKEINDDDNGPNAFNTIEQEFGRTVSSMEVELIKSFLAEGISEAIICEAIRRARKAGALRFDYVETVIKNWRADNVRDMAGVARADLAHEQRKQRNEGKQKSISKPDKPKSKSKYDLIRNLPS